MACRKISGPTRILISGNPERTCDNQRISGAQSDSRTLVLSHAEWVRTAAGTKPQSAGPTRIPICGCAARTRDNQRDLDEVRSPDACALDSALSNQLS